MEQKNEFVDWIEAKILQKTTIVDEAGNYLILTRATDRPGARSGKDDLSGGSLNKKDFEGGKQHSHEEAIAREVFEETGLVASNFEIVFIDSGTKITQSAGEIIVLVLGYKCVVVGIKPGVNLSEEHSDFRWVSKEEALMADFGEDGDLHKSILENS